MATIRFTFEDPEKEDQVVHDVPIGDSVLETALKNNIELHHNCGGVCACSTCHVYLSEGEEAFPDITDKEEDFIDRARNPRLDSRLACQLVLERDLDGEIVIEVPDQSQIQGE